MDYYEAVASQPDQLEASARAATSQLAETDLEPWRSGTVAIVSMGASSHAAQALVHRLSRYGRRASAIDASDVIALGPDADVADSYVFVSEGGRSRETIEAARAVPAGARLAITNAPSAPISEVCDAVLGLGHGEDSKVYTIGYTATLQAFGLLATALDGELDAEDWPGVPALVARVVADLAEPALRVAERLDGATSIDVVGSGPSRASVAETALLLRESTRTATAAFETYQYLHGPMESLTPSHAVLLLGDDREVTLARYLAGVGVPVVLITSTDEPEAEGLSVLRIPEAAPITRAILQVLPPQLIAGQLALRRGLGIDGFLYHQDDTKIDQVPVA